MNSNVHSSYYRPRIFPIKGAGAPSEIHRAQSIDPTISLNSEKVEEIGRDGKVGSIKKSPTVGYRLTQLEYGNLEFWQKIVNSEVLGNDGEDAIELNDFKTPYFDICAYLTDDNEDFVGTVYYPSLRCSGFSFTIGDPQANIERGFDFVGEAAHTFTDDNKYLIYQKEDILADDTDKVLTLDKTATVDPDVASKYMQRVVRVTVAGVTSELSKSAGDYIEDTTTVTVASVSTGDTIKLYYTSSSAPDVQFTLNDIDVPGIAGDSVSIYLYVPGSGKPSSGDYLYRLQSATLDVSFDREDQREIGNKDVVTRGVTNNTVTVTLGKILDDFTVDEVLRGVVDGYGKIDISKLSDQISLIIKVYEDNTKSTFKYGFIASGLSPTDVRGPGAAVNSYVEEEATLEGETLKITASPSILGV